MTQRGSGRRRTRESLLSLMVLAVFVAAAVAAVMWLFPVELRQTGHWLKSLAGSVFG